MVMAGNPYSDRRACERIVHRSYNNRRKITKWDFTDAQLHGFNITTLQVTTMSEILKKIGFKLTVI